MSINPALYRPEAHEDPEQRLTPCLATAEVRVMERSNVTLEVRDRSQTVSGQGRAVVTNQRFCFIKDGTVESHKIFTSISFPLALLGGPGEANYPELNQPIFGTTNLKGICRRDEASETPLDGTAEWTLRFRAGGFKTFHFGLRGMIRHVRGTSSQRGPPDLSAFVDPDDPTVIFVQEKPQ